jgi:PAS domain S-box-containing protein
MKIQGKIWLATALVLLVLLGITSVVRYHEIKANIAAELLDDAENVRGILMATRRVYHRQFLASGLPVNEKTVGFLPAHSLSRIAKDFPNWADSGLYFNAVSDRPRNPDNKADASELAAMDWFRANPKAEQRLAELVAADGKAYFHFTSPLYIEAYCLICHGDRAAAPATIRDTYSEAYGYKLGDLRGVLSIKIPMARLEAQAWAIWRNEMLLNLAGYGVLFFVLGFLINRLVTARLARLEKTAEALAGGDYSRRSLQNGSDEVSSLARAIDQMASEVQARDRTVLDRERKLSVILGTAPVGIGVSVDRVITEANDALCRLLDCTRDEAIGQSTATLYENSAEADRVGKIRDEQIAAHGICTVETCWRRRGGDVVSILLTISPLTPGNVDQGVVFAVLDISERKRYEQRLEQAQAELEAKVVERTADLSAALDLAKIADQAKDAFLANVSHELRTPLNAVIGLSSLARRSSTEIQQQDQLDKVIGAGKTLASLINDLLDLSKIVAGRMEFEALTFSLRGVVHRCNSLISYKAAEKGLKLIEQIDDAVPDALVGDALRVEQVLINLLSNAVKFTAAGQVVIRVGLQSRDASHVCLMIEVEDTGLGMSEAEMAQLFKPFAQADASMSRKHGGTGLGLALCRKLVEMMGGEIGVSSVPGQGSIFRASLCFAPGDATDIVAASPPGAEEKLRYRDARVLVVDDQPLNREIVEALLKLVGIAARMAGNGQEALDILEASGPQAFDLVLMDIQMPVMDGLVAAHELRSRAGFAALPIIAMTAHTMTHEKEASARAGMNDHIGKPFDNAGFYRTLARWMPEAKRLSSAELPDSFISDPVGASLSFPSLKGVDTAAGLARLGGNQARYRHWLMGIAEEGPATVVQIRETLAASHDEAARQLIHAFKGRVGMLGMDDLHLIASGLEAALKNGEPVSGRLDRMAQVLAQTGEQIRARVGVRQDAPDLVDGLPELLAESTPEAVTQLLRMLDASDGGCATALARCLEALKDTPWAPHLQQALGQVQRFDFAAARKTLSGGLPLSPEGRGA